MDASSQAAPSARQTELLDAAWHYVLQHGLADMSLRPLAQAIGSSPRVLLFLFESKDGLVRALLARARAAEQEALAQVREQGGTVGEGVQRIWAWLAEPEHRGLLVLWAEAYVRSLVEPDGAWAGFAQRTVDDWLALLAQLQPADRRRTAAGEAERTAALALLRGALLDLLASGDRTRTSAAITGATTERPLVDRRR